MTIATNLHIRKFTEADRDALKRIYLETRSVTFYWMRKSKFELNDFDEDTKGEAIWVAEVGGIVAGFMALWMPGNFVHHLYLDKLYHRKGIGKALLNKASEVCRVPLTLKCLIRNKQAFNFYISLGWRIRANEIDDLGRYFLLSQV
ncbi:GNAT family N-acetyltransferase [Mucilaginibacter polytrichastri]|uniref:N-acetyltransferase domain-containing protein n=1 Tax=Mucilaginibacter polytrichastri TaxID=1302689 RepID=A0A1Q6A1A6_9SPHI|nr:GNAT family N-acetyltransferase [Mucilaginibacter polytrichastri]OKS87799.1 hypothetical protein RG47T_3261 [Mucilaginibacter polytrichastri]SFT26864.1 Ribosomal protein S18 acetylase RimI [Mucilaginibacter polytrichastri]